MKSSERKWRREVHVSREALTFTLVARIPIQFQAVDMIKAAAGSLSLIWRQFRAEFKTDPLRTR